MTLVVTDVDGRAVAPRSPHVHASTWRRRTSAASVVVAGGRVGAKPPTQTGEVSCTASALRPGGRLTHAAAEGADESTLRSVLAQVADPGDLAVDGGASCELPPAGTVERLQELVAGVADEVRSWPGLQWRIEAHHGESVREHHHCGGRRTSMQAHGAVVVDAFRDRRFAADADHAWSGTVGDGVAVLERIDGALHRAGLSAAPAPARVQLLLEDGSAGAFLHEVCGHLVEHTSGRPSLVAGTLDGPLAQDFLTIADDPTRAGAFGRHEVTALGLDTRPRPLLDSGRLVGLLTDDAAGPWRADRGSSSPAPRMTWLTVRPHGTGTLLEQALGAVRAPVVRVHRLGLGSLDHRTGAVTVDVRDATVEVAGEQRRLAPFAVTGEARRLLAGIAAVGDERTMAPWTAYCLGESGRLPVGADVPRVLTGPVSTTVVRAGAPS